MFFKQSRKTICLLVALLMTLSLLPGMRINVQAAEGGTLKIGSDLSQLPLNENQSGDNWSWATATNTLTLEDGFNVDVGGIVFDSTEDIIINVLGTATVNFIKQDFSMSETYSLTIQGDANAVLNLSNNNNTNGSLYGAIDTNNIVISGLTVNVATTGLDCIAANTFKMDSGVLNLSSANLSGIYGYGIKTTDFGGDIIISGEAKVYSSTGLDNGLRSGNGSIKVSGNAIVDIKTYGNSTALFCLENLEISGGTVTAESVDSSSKKSTAIYAKNGIDLTKGTLNVTGYIGKFDPNSTDLRVSDDDSIVDATGNIYGNLTVNKGDVNLTGNITKALTINGGAVTHSGNVREEFIHTDGTYNGDDHLATASTFTSATTSADGTKVLVTFSRDMSASGLAVGDFTVKNNSENAVTDIALNSNPAIVELTLTNPVTYGQTVTVAYTKGTAKAENGRALATFGAQPVTNVVPEGATAPTFTSATTSTDGTKVLVTFNKAMNETGLVKTDFTVNNGSENAVTAIALNSNPAIVELTLTTPVTSGQTVTVAYAKGTAKAEDGGELASFGAEQVTNSVVVLSDAKLSALSISSGTLTPVFNEDVTSYTANVANNITSITISATPKEDGAIVSGTGVKSLNVGLNTINISVKNSDTSSKTYTISVTRASDSGSGGSNGGGGSNGSQSTTPSKPTETVKDNTVSTGGTTDKDGNVTADISKDSIDKAIDNAVKESQKQTSGENLPSNDTQEKPAPEVVITVGKQDTTSSVDVNINNKAVESLAKTENVVLTVKAGNSSLTFDHSAIETIKSNAGSSDVTIHVATADKAKLTEAQKKAVGNNDVYDLSVLANGKKISDFKGNVSVTLPYTPKIGEDTDAIIVYYMNVNGELNIVENAVYDPLTKSITFAVTHFSYYIIGYNYVAFGDVKPDFWGKNAIDFVAARGLVTGVGNGMFDPDRAITRAEFIQMIQNVVNIKTSDSSSYGDIGENAWYYKAISAAKSAGLLDGLAVSDNKLMPNQVITREEMAVILANTAKYLKVVQTKSKMDVESFKDYTAINNDFVESIETVIDLGLMSENGIGNGMFDPKGATTRAQAAQIQKNLLTVFNISE